MLLTSLRTKIRSRDFPIVLFFRFTFLKKRENTFTKKKFLHFHYWKFNIVVATHVALSLPVVTVKEKKKNYNPVCWLLSLTEDWTVLGVFNENQVGCFQQKKWRLSSFYGLTMYFTQNFLLFLVPFSTIWEICSVRRVNLLALRLSSSSHEERFHVGYIASRILFFFVLFCFLLFQFVLKV